MAFKLGCSKSDTPSRTPNVQIRDITITADQANALRHECNLPGPLEGACQLLCGASHLDDDPWAVSSTTGSHLRLTLHRLEPLPAKSLRTTRKSVSWDMDAFVRLLRKTRDEQLHPGICHSHPNSSATFSLQDDQNEAHLRDVLQRRNRDETQVLVSILLRGDGRIESRMWTSHGPPQNANVRVLGPTLDDASPLADALDPDGNPTFLHRQALSIGQDTVDRLRRLRVGVVGCGGTGSAVAVLLARAGIGRLLLQDPDLVAETNLNRLHGSTHHDAELRRPKVEVLRDHIEAMGLGTRIALRQSPLADASTARALRSCDLLFGCTDDHLGRLILNRMAYYYLLPVIDTGLSVLPRLHGRPAHISGRVTVLRPGTACLLCRGIISPRRAREQGLRRKRPDEYDQQLKEGYITDTDIPTPVVGTFTTETAAAAVNELLAGLAGLRGQKGWASERTMRFDIDRCRPTGATPRSGCPVCADALGWGLSDVQPFLDLAGL